MSPATTPSDAVVPGDVSALRQFAGVVVPMTLATALADYLFWDGRLGVSVGIFFVGIGLLVFLRQRGKPRASIWIIALLLAATCVQSAIELSLSSALVAVALTVALAGNVFQPHLGSFWARFSEALFGLLTAPRRWLDLNALAARGVGVVRASNAGLPGSAAFAFRAIFPAIVLLVIFGAIFAAGNAVFGDYLQRANDAAFNLWEDLDVTPLRILWWGLVATVALGIFHGTRAPEEPRWWTRLIPRVPRGDARLATWQTATALLAMNALFCVVNTLDAIFVWGNAALPPGIGYSEFVHSGVNSLIAAVVLSAVVIAGMFQQEDGIAGNRWLKRLAHLWVAQNFLLIGAVLRRLMLYTEAYQLTEKRVYVGCFLVLVAAGFILLARFVQKRRSFNWLIGSNALATFALFFVLQFLDVAGWVARHNVKRWEQGAGIDLDYLASLGPTAWPELIRVARSTKQAPTEVHARQLLREIADEPRSTNWRGFQWREAKGLRAVSAYLASQ